MKDNAPIGDAMADRAKITAKDNVFTLEITKVAAGDKGNYTCRVTNDNGEAVACSAQLEVHACKYENETDIFSESVDMYVFDPMLNGHCW